MKRRCKRDEDNEWKEVVEGKAEALSCGVHTYPPNSLLQCDMAHICVLGFGSENCNVRRPRRR